MTCLSWHKNFSTNAIDVGVLENCTPQPISPLHLKIPGTLDLLIMTISPKKDISLQVQPNMSYIKKHVSAS